jgi:hypothetical protein
LANKIRLKSHLSKSSTARSLKDRFSFAEASNNPLSQPLEFINSLDNPIVVYNRVPKTASTAFTHLLYDLTQGLTWPMQPVYKKQADGQVFDY